MYQAKKPNLLISCITFAHVLFLLQDKHVMVEKLLQLFIAKIDTELLEPVVLKNLKARYVEHPDETNPA